MSLTRKEIRENIQNLNSEIEKQADLLFVESIEDFFKNNPTIVSIQWKQYAPYFNDGSPCEFSMDQLTVLLTDEARDKTGKEIDEDEDYDDEDGYVDSDHLIGKTAKAVEELESDLRSIESYLERKFGSDSKVTIKKNGIVTFDEYCDHD